MSKCKRLSFLLILFSLFSFSYFVTSASADHTPHKHKPRKAGLPGYNASCDNASGSGSFQGATPLVGQLDPNVDERGRPTANCINFTRYGYPIEVGEPGYIDINVPPSDFGRAPRDGNSYSIACDSRQDTSPYGNNTWESGSCIDDRGKPCCVNIDLGYAMGLGDPGYEIQDNAREMCKNYPTPPADMPPFMTLNWAAQNKELCEFIASSDGSSPPGVTPPGTTPPTGTPWISKTWEQFRAESETLRNRPEYSTFPMENGNTPFYSYWSNKNGELDPNNPDAEIGDPNFILIKEMEDLCDSTSSNYGPTLDTTRPSQYGTRQGEWEVCAWVRTVKAENPGPPGEITPPDGGEVAAAEARLEAAKIAFSAAEIEVADAQTALDKAKADLLVAEEKAKEDEAERVRIAEAAAAAAAERERIANEARIAEEARIAALEQERIKAEEAAEAARVAAAEEAATLLAAEVAKQAAALASTQTAASDAKATQLAAIADAAGDATAQAAAEKAYADAAKAAQQASLEAAEEAVRVAAEQAAAAALAQVKAEAAKTAQATAQAHADAIRAAWGLAPATPTPEPSIPEAIAQPGPNLSEKGFGEPTPEQKERTRIAAEAAAAAEAAGQQ